MLKLNVRSSASSDLAEVLAYYAAASPTLPEAFLEQVEIALTLLRGSPHVGSRRFAHFFPGIDLRTWSRSRGRRRATHRARFGSRLQTPAAGLACAAGPA